MLINVRKIKPRNMGGAKKGSMMTCHFQGDYPLVLQDENGGIHCRVIKNVLVSDDSAHNLISLHDLRDIDVGFEFDQSPTVTRAIAGLVQGLAEAVNFGMKAGLNMEDVVEVISKGAAGSWQMENRHKTMIEGKFDFGFAVEA
jgi:hypothetical protein